MITVTPDVVAAHQVTPDEYQRIVKILGREPTYTELGIVSVMWSEHCSYKSSRLHLKKLPTRGSRVLQGPGENAGIIDLGGGVAVAFKIESHNHPSFIEPFQGAATGVGGILRDIFTMGARPIAVLDALRFGPIDKSPSSARNARILEGVVSGIAHYGNCFGVPTVGGETVFEECYSGNPLVNVFALGIIETGQVYKGRADGPGNPVIYVGAKTGRDGIHGASMASAEFTEASQQKRPNVQVGDPFMEKLLLEACLEAMQIPGAIVGIQDMGAAGLTSSSCEMSARAGTGIEIDMDRVPQRETGMTAYEIMLSESQERMLLVAQAGREEEVFRVFRKWGLDAVTIGHVTDTGRMVVREKGQIVADIPSRELADSAPLYDRPRTAPYRTAPVQAKEIPASADLGRDLETILSSGDICSKHWIWEQYDYMVRTNTVTGPGSDAAVLRIKGLDTFIGVSLDGNGRYCYLDPREGTKLIVAECCRNLSAAGALPVATTNNLNFGNPERPEIMAQLVESIEGLADACSFFDVPVTGGNVSLYNETLGEAIYPTPVVGIVGLFEDRQPVGIGFPKAGLSVMLIGGLGASDDVRFGSSQYVKHVISDLWGLPPVLDMDYERAVQITIREAIARGLVLSSHDLGDGGLAVALAESSFPFGVGAKLDVDTPMRPEFLLFGESPSRILVSCEDPKSIQEVASRFGVSAAVVGVTMEGRLQVRNRQTPLMDCDIPGLRARWASSLEGQIRR